MFRRLTVDECKTRANKAADEERWTEALSWVRRAQDLVKNDPDLLADEGEYLYKMGLFEESLSRFLEADRTQTEGYCAWRAAEAALAAGKARDEVLTLLDRALKKSPDLAADLELAQNFADFRDTPECQAMIRKAYEWLGIPKGDSR